jgi:hypothetical protein
MVRREKAMGTPSKRRITRDPKMIRDERPMLMNAPLFL